MPITSDPTGYEQPWRRNYERYAATMWLTGAAGYAAAGYFSGLPSGPLYCTAALCAGMGLLRLPGAVKLAALQRNVGGRPLSVVTIQNLRKLSEKEELRDSLWLGKGFVWTPEHTQRLYELMRLDWSNIAEESRENSVQAALRGAGDFARLARSAVSDVQGEHEHKIREMGQKWIHGVDSVEHDIWQPLSHAAGHTLIVGTTGAGKTRCFDILITQAILKGDAVIIVDPKGDAEMRDNAKAACEACGRGRDFVMFNPAFPDESVRINPLANYNEVTDIPSRIAALLGGSGEADAFRDFGWLAMNQICQALYVLDRPMTLKSIRRHLEMGGEDLFLDLMDFYGPKVLGEEAYGSALTTSAEKLGRYASPVKCAVDVYKSHIVNVAPSNAVDGMVSLIEHDKAHFGKMITSLIPILAKLTSGSLGTLLSPDEPGHADPRPMRNMKYFVDTQKVVYIGLNSLADSIVGSALGSALLADLTAVSGGRYNYAEERSPVTVFVDEAAEVVNDPLIQLLNKGRGAGFRLYVATQLFADFASRLGSEEKANQVLGNLNNIIALRTIEPQTQEFITSRMPKTRVSRLERSQSQSVSAKDPTLHGANIGERLVQEEVPLFPPELLGALPGLEFIGVVSGGHVVKSRIPFLARSEEAAETLEASLRKNR